MCRQLDAAMWGGAACRNFIDRPARKAARMRRRAPAPRPRPTARPRKPSAAIPGRQEPRQGGVQGPAGPCRQRDSCGPGSGGSLCPAPPPLHILAPLPAGER